MVTIEVAGLYIAVLAAIIAGLLLVWAMLVELVRFDSRANRPRTARIPSAAPRVEATRLRGPRVTGVVRQREGIRQAAQAAQR